MVRESTAAILPFLLVVSLVESKGVPRSGEGFLAILLISDEPAAC